MRHIWARRGLRLRAAAVGVLVTAGSVSLIFLAAGGAGPGTAAAVPGQASGSARLLAPAPGVPWQYQLQASAGSQFAASGGIDVTVCERPVSGGRCVRPEMFDIDLYGPDGVLPNAKAVRAIRRSGGYAICYVDAGTWENWRPDASRFPRSVLGRPNGWPGERWLDIRRTRVLLPLLAARVAKCARAGFQGVEFDNVDGYENDTGFPLTASEQIRYDQALARLAHARGLAAGLKNDYGQVRALVRRFDFAIDEQCAQYGECGQLRPFLRAGKAVFDVEYAAPASRLCAEAETAGVVAIAKRPDLLALPWLPCR